MLSIKVGALVMGYNVFRIYTKKNSAEQSSHIKLVRLVKFVLSLAISLFMQHTADTRVSYLATILASIDVQLRDYLQINLTNILLLLLVTDYISRNVENCYHFIIENCTEI